MSPEASEVAATMPLMNEHHLIFYPASTGKSMVVECDACDDSTTLTTANLYELAYLQEVHQADSYRLTDEDYGRISYEAQAAVYQWVNGWEDTTEIAKKGDIAGAKAVIEAYILDSLKSKPKPPESKGRVRLIRPDRADHHVVGYDWGTVVDVLEWDDGSPVVVPGPKHGFRDDKVRVASGFWEHAEPQPSEPKMPDRIVVLRDSGDHPVTVHLGQVYEVDRWAGPRYKTACIHTYGAECWIAEGDWGPA